MTTRLIPLAIALFAVLGVSACSKDPSPAPAQTSQASSEDTLQQAAHNGAENMQKQREAMRKNRENNKAADPFDIAGPSSSPAKSSTAAPVNH